MNEYEAKQEARRERYETRAEKADQESDAQFENSRRITEHIPFGQPILVGHHSEGRHRRDIARSNSAMQKSCDARDKAEHYRNKAAGVGKGGISSDDPDAVQKLRDKLGKLEELQAFSKRLNAYFRKHGTCKGVDGLTDEQAAGFDEKVEKAYSFQKKPCPSYELTNRNGNMRRIRERIKELEASAAEPEGETINGEGYTIEESKEINRIKFIFDTKPSREVCKLLRSQGWRWSRTEMAWLRHLNNGGRYSAQSVARQLESSELLAAN